MSDNIMTLYHLIFRPLGQRSRSQLRDLWFSENEYILVNIGDHSSKKLFKAVQGKVKLWRKNLSYIWSGFRDSKVYSFDLLKFSNFRVSVCLHSRAFNWLDTFSLFHALLTQNDRENLQKKSHWSLLNGSNATYNLNILWLTLKIQPMKNCFWQYASPL